MHIESRVPGQPVLHRRVLMGGVVVGDQVQSLVLGRLAVDFARELQLLNVRVALLALTDDLAVQHVQRGEQRGRAVALIVVRHRLCSPLLQRQPRLRAVQRLHLALFVAAQHQGVLGRGHVQAHDVLELVDELRIPRDFEAAHDMWLEPVRLPMPHDGAALTPRTAPILRVLQCVAAGGVVCVVSSTSLALSYAYVAFVAGRRRR